MYRGTANSRFRPNGLLAHYLFGSIMCKQQTLRSTLLCSVDFVVFGIIPRSTLLCLVDFVIWISCVGLMAPSVVETGLFSLMTDKGYFMPQRLF